MGKLTENLAAPTLKSAIATNHALVFQDARNDAQEFFKPYLKKWLPLQQKLGKLDEDFMNPDLWIFDEMMDEEFHFYTTAYQEIDDYYSSYWVAENYTQIPAAFIDNPILYAAEQMSLREKAEASSKEREKQAALANIKSLEDSLVSARVQFANTYSEG